MFAAVQPRGHCLHAECLAEGSPPGGSPPLVLRTTHYLLEFAWSLIPEQLNRKRAQVPIGDPSPSDSQRLDVFGPNREGSCFLEARDQHDTVTRLVSAHCGSHGRNDTD